MGSMYCAGGSLCNAALVGARQFPWRNPAYDGRLTQRINSSQALRISMSRYRPPRPASSPYITRRGYNRLQQELACLWKEKRPEITRKVAEAAAQGDRSENAEYIYGKRQLREIDNRIQFLSRRLDALQVVEQLPGQRDTVFFGAWVTLASDKGESATYRIVGADEFDTDPCYISIDAPLARKLIGKHLHDEITFEHRMEQGASRILQSGDQHICDRYVIVNIEYREN